MCCAVSRLVEMRYVMLCVMLCPRTGDHCPMSRREPNNETHCYVSVLLAVCVVLCCVMLCCVGLCCVELRCVVLCRVLVEMRYVMLCLCCVPQTGDHCPTG